MYEFVAFIWYQFYTVKIFFLLFINLLFINFFLNFLALFDWLNTKNFWHRRICCVFFVRSAKYFFKISYNIVTDLFPKLQSNELNQMKKNMNFFIVVVNTITFATPTWKYLRKEQQLSFGSSLNVLINTFPIFKNFIQSLLFREGYDEFIRPAKNWSSRV